MFHKIRNGELTREGFEKSLATYQRDKIVLLRNAQKFGLELFKTKLQELEMSISMVELFLEKFDDIKKAKDFYSKHRLVK